MSGDDQNATIRADHRDPVVGQIADDLEDSEHPDSAIDSERSDDGAAGKNPDDRRNKPIPPWIAPTTVWEKPIWSRNGVSPTGRTDLAAGRGSRRRDQDAPTGPVRRKKSEKESITAARRD